MVLWRPRQALRKFMPSRKPRVVDPSWICFCDWCVLLAELVDTTIACSAWLVLTTRSFRAQNIQTIRVFLRRTQLSAMFEPFEFAITQIKCQHLTLMLISVSNSTISHNKIQWWRERPRDDVSFWIPRITCLCLLTHAQMQCVFSCGTVMPGPDTISVEFGAIAAPFAANSARASAVAQEQPQPWQRWACTVIPRCLHGAWFQAAATTGSLRGTVTVSVTVTVAEGSLSRWCLASNRIWSM
jgi:hypothetical protein